MPDRPDAAAAIGVSAGVEADNRISNRSPRVVNGNTATVLGGVPGDDRIVNQGIAPEGKQPSALRPVDVAEVLGLIVD